MAQNNLEERNQYGLNQQDIYNILLFRMLVNFCKGNLPEPKQLGEFETYLGLKPKDLAANCNEGFSLTSKLLLSDPDIRSKVLKMEIPGDFHPLKRDEIIMFREMVHKHGGELPNQEQIQAHAKAMGGDSQPDCIEHALKEGMYHSAKIAMNDPEVLRRAIKLPIC